MNPLHRAALRLNAGLKTFGRMVFGRSAWGAGWSWGRRSAYDYMGQVDARGSSLVVACVRWIARTFPEAPLQISRRTRDGPEAIPDHPLTLLLERPNPAYSGLLLWSATLAELTVTGNAYWLKVRSEADRPVELWWVPSNLIEPRWPEDGSEFISHYDYTPDGTPHRLEPSDVVHFRDGLDPANIRKGLSPLASLFRELWTDEEAALYTATLLRNGGGPGVILSPDDKDINLDDDQTQAVKAKFEANFGGDNRGRVMVMGGPTKVERMGFTPKEMDLAVLRRPPEERVTAVLGIPSAVVGFGSGLEQTKVGATMAELRELAYESNIIPTQRLIGAEIKAQLLPDFGDTASLDVGWDLTQVRVLQEDRDKLYGRLTAALSAGGITLRQYQNGLGMAPKNTDDLDVYYIPGSVTPTAPEDLLAPPEPQLVTTVEPPRALPAPKALRLVGRKSADDLPDRLQRLRARLESRAGHDLTAFFATQGARIAAALEAGTSEDALVGDVEAALLGDALQPHYRRALTAVHELTQDALGVSFDLDDPAVRDYLRVAGANIPGISQTTRDAVREALAEGQAAGEGVDQLAARLRGLPQFTQERALVVARTEMGYAANHAALASYGASGVVVGVRVHDGDQDEPCAAANGRTLSLADAGTFPRLQHPNCTRAFAPLTEASQLEAAA